MHETVPTPFTTAQTEMYEFCQEFLRTRNMVSIEKFGKTKLYNIPFNYCMFYQIYRYEIEKGEVVNPENYKELLKLFAQMSEIRAAM